jgi:hypothetical protein
MACPYVAGTVAQWLEKDNTLTPSGVREALQCGAVNGTIAEVFGNDPTKNFMLQVPRENSSATCDLGAGCASDCSGNGACNVGSSGCDCNKGWTGDTCSAVDPRIVTCNDINATRFVFFEYSASGQSGWFSHTFELRNNLTNELVDNNTLSCGDYGAEDYCLDFNATYKLTFEGSSAFGTWTMSDCASASGQTLFLATDLRDFFFTISETSCLITYTDYTSGWDDWDWDDNYLLDDGEIAGIALAGVVLVCGLGFLVYRCLDRTRHVRLPEPK